MKFTGLAAIAVITISTPLAAQSLVAAPNEASAKLGQCFVDNTTGNDRTLVARWMAGSMASSPMMDGLVEVDTAAKEQVDRSMADLFARLLTKDCKAQAKVVMDNRDQMGMQAAGGRLGEIAMAELMMDPAAMRAMMAYIQYIDPASFAALSE